MDAATDVEVLSKETVFKGYFRIDRYRLRHRTFAGGWTAEMVRCEFGPPAEVESYPSGRNRGTVWSYHYMSPSGLFKLFNVNFGEDGQTVRSFDTDVDPERDPSMFGFSN